MVESRSKEIDGQNYTVTQMPARKALKLTHRLGKALGPAFSHLAAGHKDGVNLDFSEVGRAIESLFAALSEEDLDIIVKELLNSATVTTEKGIQPVLPQIDILLAGRMDTMFKLIGFALEVNYGSFLDVAKRWFPGDLMATASSSGE